MQISSYRDLKVWQLALDLVQVVYEVTDRFPRTETYGLGMQMRKSAVSVPSNIAEGHARESTREFLRFLSIASASLAELETQIVIAQRLKYTQSELSRAFAISREVGKMLRGLERSLHRRRSRRCSLAPGP